MGGGGGRDGEWEGVAVEPGALSYSGEDKPADVTARVLIIRMRLPPLTVGYIHCV